MKFTRKRTLEAGRLDIAPLIDVVLLLLIFFMLTSSFITPAGIRINLPQSSASEPQEKESMTISISEDEEIFFKEEKIHWSELKSSLISSRIRFPELILIIKADKNVRHGKVVEVMSSAQEAGWERMAIAAHPENEVGEIK